MKFKLGMLVTAKKWYLRRRVWGRVVYTGKEIGIQGKFGLESFHPSSVRIVRGGKKK